MKNRFITTPVMAGIAIVCLLTACQPNDKTPPTAEEARAFLQDTEKRLHEMSLEANAASWLAVNFITIDSEFINAKVGERATALGVEVAKKAAHFDSVELNNDERRQLNILKMGLTLPAPSDPVKTAELSKLSSVLESTYNKGEYCPEGGKCLSLNEMTVVMSTERDHAKLLNYWQGWHKVSPPMRADYQRLVEIANEGSRELGFKDTGDLWRSKYDMSSAEFAADYDNQWNKVKPLYEALHCHVRAKLGEVYGNDVVPQDKPIPAHLLGNMWAQTWGSIYDLVAPKNAGTAVDTTALLAKAGMDEIAMVKTAEKFFTSLGFDPLPDTFWERSLFIEPVGYKAGCHASAWNLDNKEDLRIKMCIKKTGDDFQVVHHELGHNFYQRAYNQQPLLFRDSANDGFHEALGDTISLSVTPKYLVDIGLLDKEPDASNDINLLLQQAMDSIAFLPFGLLVDKWRWGVFSGEIKPENYNKAWWDLRLQYQGLRPPVERSENDFDPGAKYHIPANTPYARYFLARIQQFQFHRALCQTANYQGPLHRCSIYNNKEAGAKLKAMMEMGASRPWPEAMNALTGQSELDASAIIDYFAPLKKWLDKENADRICGWQSVSN